MVRCPASTKSSISTSEARIASAVKDYKAGKFKSIRDAATAYDVTYSKLRNRLAGVEPKGVAQSAQQIITPWEEKAIVRWILQLDDWGFPPKMKYVKDMATSFLRSRDGGLAVNLGKNWTTRFLARHPELDSKFAVRLDKQRGYANNPTIIKDFFKQLFAIVVKYKILPNNTYNMDEKGFLMGRSTSVKVICRRGKKRNFKIQDGIRELITVIETISAGGKVLPPSIIYKGVAIYSGWMALVKAGDKAHFSTSSTGWSNQKLGLAYLTENFEPNTRAIADNGKATRLLILDGHTSHVTWEFFDHCLSNNIIPLCLPAHSTHLLQPLDVGIFGPLQRNYSSLLDDFLDGGGPGIHKGTFYPLLVKARELTYTSKNILSAFEATGISPHNPRRVLNTLESILGAGSSEAFKTAPKSEPGLPSTPQNGRSVFFHTRKTMSLFKGKSPQSVYKKAMVTKLANAAAQSNAELVLLKEEIKRLEKNLKATKINNTAKVKSRKVLSKALVVTVEEVIRLREEQEKKEQVAAEKKTRNAEKKSAKNAKTEKDTATKNIKGRKKKIPAPIIEDSEEYTSESD